MKRPKCLHLLKKYKQNITMEKNRKNTKQRVDNLDYKSATLTMKWKILQKWTLEFLIMYTVERLKRVSPVEDGVTYKWRKRNTMAVAENKNFYLVRWNQALFLLELVVFPRLLSGSYIVVDIVLWDFAPVM